MDENTMKEIYIFLETKCNEIKGYQGSVGHCQTIVNRGWIEALEFVMGEIYPYIEDEEKMQTEDNQINSQHTCTKQFPRILHAIDFNKYNTILDYGCGKFDITKDFIESNGARYYGMDKYWKTFSENQRVDTLFNMMNGNKLIICSNVLNTIDNDDSLNKTLEDIKCISLLNKADVLFTVYECDRSGQGKQTTKGYQRNLKTKNYVPYLSKYFDSVVIKKGVIHCSN